MVHKNLEKEAKSYAGVMDCLVINYYRKREERRSVEEEKKKG